MSSCNAKARDVITRIAWAFGKPGKISTKAERSRKLSQKIRSVTVCVCVCAFQPSPTYSYCTHTYILDKKKTRKEADYIFIHQGCHISLLYTTRQQKKKKKKKEKEKRKKVYLSHSRLCRPEEAQNKNKESENWILPENQKSNGT